MFINCRGYENKSEPHVTVDFTVKANCLNFLLDKQKFTEVIHGHWCDALASQIYPRACSEEIND